MANRLARGERTSLAVPALANLFKCLRVLTSCRDPSYCGESIPFHFLSAWFHYHWSGLYTPVMEMEMRRGLQLMAMVVGTVPFILDAVGARLKFFQSRTHLRSLLDRVFPSYTSRMSDYVYTDEASQCRRRRDALWGSSEGDFLVSIRHGFLPLRLGDRIVLEPYMPHRCAHQFRLDQDIPLLVPVPQDLSADLEGLARSWAYLLHTGTGVRFLMPKTSRVGIFTSYHVRWFWDSVSQWYSYRPAALVNLVCPSHVDPTNVRNVLPPRRVPDLMGFDSLFPRAPLVAPSASPSGMPALPPYRGGSKRRKKDP